MAAEKMNISKFLVKENNNLDFIRIVAASMVIVGHSYAIDPFPGKMDLVKMLTGWTFSGALAVKIFFFISGLLVTDSLLKKQSVRSFLISRVFRMMPGLLLVLLVAAFIVGPVVSTCEPAVYFSSPVTYWYVIKNMFFVSNYALPGVFLDNAWANTVNGSLWSLRYEVRCYLFLLVSFVLCFYTLKRYRIFYNVLIAFIFIDAIFQLNILARPVHNTEFSLLPMSFALGSLLAVNKEQIVLDYRIIAGSLALTIGFWHFRPVNEIFFITTVCMLVIWISGMTWTRRIRIRHDISYGVYLWGFLVQQMLVHYLVHPNLYLFMLYALLLSWVMGFISFVSVEKRFMAYGRQLDKKWSGLSKAKA